MQNADEPNAPWHALFAETHPAPGDLAVHLEHGLGRVVGLKRLEVDGMRRELVALEYRGGIELLVPLHELDRVWRYGPDRNVVKLDRLGGKSWLKRRHRLLGEIEGAARRLMNRRTERDARRIKTLPAADERYDTFVANFPHADTEDQRLATEEVLKDLSREVPMERVLIGDVGFGKTEVALRAAARVVFAGRQVAIVAPTTVLARQHARSFSERFAPFDIEVGELSSAVSGKQRAATRAKLADGTLRIVVGTHAVASRKVSFAEPGLVVIDEEHRFGSRRKNRLKRLGRGVHCLSMTATPIPATLTAAEIGLADVSLLTEAPCDRQASATRVINEDFDEACAVLSQELDRGGQAFVVCARIRDLHRARKALLPRLPEARMAFAHGKLPSGDADDALRDFSEGRADLLLATTIVETGIDVPNANALVIVGADKLGLAQLHQLRGRVGRGRKDSTVLAMVNDADKPNHRLDTYIASSGLGAGFELALSDRDTRGAGRLLGKRQAGHVTALGPNLYRTLLRAALEGASPVERVAALSLDVTVPTAGYLEEETLPDEALRMATYFRHARTGQIEPGNAEVVGRQSLQANRALRTLASELSVLRLDVADQAFAVTFPSGRLTAETRAALSECCEGDGAEVVWRDDKLIVRGCEKPQRTGLPAIYEFTRERLGRIQRHMAAANV